MLEQKVLVLWADPDSPNFGVRALAQGVLDSLPTESVVTFASHRRPLESGSLSLKRLGVAAFLPWGKTRSELASYDLIIDVGEGDSFASIYGAKRYAKMIASKLAAARAGGAFVLAPQTLGPWENSWTRVCARVVMKKADRVWARDSNSIDRASNIGITRASLASDLVFAIQDQPVSTRSERLVLNVSGLLWNDNPHVDHRRYRSAIQAVIESRLSDGRETILLPHVIAAGERDDDVSVARSLSRRYPELKVRIPNDLADARRTIAESDALVGSRMHACLNALSLGVPTVPLAYSDKFEALFRDLGYPYVLDLRSEQFSERPVLDLIGDAALRTSAIAARTEGQRRIADFAKKMEG